MTRTPIDGARSAVELLTAWLEAPDGPPDLLVDRLQLHIGECPTQDQLTAAVELIMGLTQVSGALLLMAEETTGHPAPEVLQEFGLLYATLQAEASPA